MLPARHLIVLPAAWFATLGAASALDCTKAKTPIEKTICGDPVLKAQDAALGRFYFDTLRTLKGARHDLLISDQRRWLADERESNCEPGAKPSAVASCLTVNLAARRRAIAICFAGAKNGAAELAGKPVTGADLCTFHYRPACPKVALTASARLPDYPWLMDPLLKDAVDASGGSGCDAKSGDTSDANQDETSTTATILAQRPNLVSVRVEDDSMETGAAHPMHDEQIKSYDPRTKAEIPIAALMPALKPGSPLLAKLSVAAEKVLDVHCCSDEADHSFGGIGLDTDTPMPNSWSVSASGDLILVYDYSALARDFVATAKIPRSVFIDAIDPKYAGFFVSDAAAR